MIRIWVNPSGIAQGGRPINVRAPAGTYMTDLVEIRDARDALIATVRYSHHRTPDSRTRVWIDVEPVAHVSISDQHLTVGDTGE